MSGNPTKARAAAPPTEAFHDEPLTLWHDIRQALATISALSVAADTDPTLSAGTRRRLASIRDEVRRVHELSDQAGHLQVAPSDAPVALHELLHPIVEAVAAAHGVEAHVCSLPAYVVGAQVGLRRVVSNLAENACSAAGPGGQVVASVGTHGPEVVLEIGDSGPGFEGRQSRPARLGLAIVESLAMAHRGHVEFDESTVGGALVRVVLPAAGVAGRAEPARLAQPGAGRSAAPSDGRAPRPDGRRP
jgi:signal transduction histidine kinase